MLEGWATGFSDRDGKFVRELQLTFNSSFWELYVHACLLDLGFRVEQPRPAPDFVAHGRAGALAIEATTASHPHDGVPESAGLALNSTPRMHDILRLASIRLANALTAKARKYRESYAALPACADRPFVVAIAAFEQPHFFLQGDNALRRVLYGYAGPIVVPGAENEHVVMGEAYTSSTKKPSGAPVKLGLFSDDSLSDVSAVLFSCTATACKLAALARDADQPVRFTAKRYNDHGTEAAIIEKWRPNYSESLLDGRMSVAL